MKTFLHKSIFVIFRPFIVFKKWITLLFGTRQPIKLTYHGKETVLCIPIVRDGGDAVPGRALR